MQSIRPHFAYLTVVIAILSLLPMRDLKAEENYGFEPVSSLYSVWHGYYSSVARGDLLYVATGYSGMQIIDFSDPDNVRVIGVCGGNEIRSLALKGNYIFATDERIPRILTIDVSDPTNPNIVAQIECDAYSLYTSNTLDTILFASINEGLIPFNISDPRQLVALPTFNTTPQELVFNGNTLYARLYDDNLATLDISDPSNIQRTAILYGNDQRGTENLQYYEGRVYSMEYDLWAYDVSDPDTILVVDTIETDFSGPFLIRDGFGYTPTRGLMQIFDLRNPAAIQLADPVPIDSLYPEAVVANGDRFYSVGQCVQYKDPLGIKIQRFRLDDPLNPQMDAEFLTKGIIQGVINYQHYLYVAAGLLGLRIVDVSDPENPVEIDTLSLGNQPSTIQLMDDRLFFADSDLRHYFLDLADPEAPELVSRIIWNSLIKPVGMMGDVFIGMADGDVLLFDMSNLEEPRLIDNYHDNLMVYDGVLQGNRILAADSRRGLLLLDLSDLGNIQQFEIEADIPATKLLLVGDIAIIESRSGNSSHLYFLDIADMNNPVVRSDLFVGQVSSMAANDSLLLIVRYNGIEAVEFTDLSTPQTVGFCVTPGKAQSVAFVNSDLAAVADMTNLGLYDLTPLRNSPRWIDLPDPRERVIVQEDDTLRVHIAASDRNGRQITLTMNRNTLPEQAVFTDNGDGSGDLYWETTLRTTGWYYPQFVADNGIGHIQTTMNIYASMHQLPPHFTEYPADTIFAEPGDTINAYFQGEDPNGYYGFVLNYVNLPEAARLRNNGDGSRTLVWTPTNVDTGLFTPWIRITDGTYSDSVQIFIVVEGSEFVAHDAQLLADFSLAKPYPNPFNSTMKIDFGATRSQPLELEVYDQTGRKVETLYSGASTGSWQSVKFSGAELGSGIYIVRLRSAEQSRIEKVVLIR